MTQRTLHYGDNLEILRNQLADESVDLIYLDPPFNSKADYNVLFKAPEGQKSDAQIVAFEDSWHWNETSERAFDDVLQSGYTDAAELLRSLRNFLRENDMMAYLTMMSARLLELHRVLKPTGSLYLHCDPTASHYLKLLIDAVFGPQNYRNEIVWQRATAHNDAARYGKITDRIFFYSKSDEYYWDGDSVRALRTKENIKSAYPAQDEMRGRYRNVDLTGPSHGRAGSESAQPWKKYDVASRGRHWSPPKKGSYADYIEREHIPGYKAIAGVHERLDALDAAGLIVHPKKGFWPGLKRYAEADIGKPPQDLITHPSGFTNYNASKGEYLGYQTQKPIALLEQLIAVSSQKGDVVLDPFCGCGTAVHAAEKLERQWVGIDITHLAISLIEKRLHDAFPDVDFVVEGRPHDLAAAHDLAERDKYQFQWWAVSLVDALPYRGKKKGADGGVDGLIYFKTDRDKVEKAIVSVKGGTYVSVAMVRDLHSAMEREKAPIAIFITLTKPTAPMLKEAAAVGLWTHEKTGRKYARLQILTIEDLFAGKQADIPWIDSTMFRRARREESGDQDNFFDKSAEDATGAQ